MTEQSLTFKGETLTIPQWAKRFGLKPETLYGRINRLKWSTDRALTEPVIKQMSKNDAEMMLNDMPKSQLPPELLTIINSDTYNGTKYGHHLRYSHRAAFNRWFQSYLESQNN